MGTGNSDSGFRIYTLLLWLLGTSLHASQPSQDFLKAHILITPDTASRSVSGEVRYQISTDPGLDSIRLDAHNMAFMRVELNGQAVPYSAGGGKVTLEAPGKAGLHEIYLEYRAQPRQALYFIGWDDSLKGNEQLWTQGQGKNSSHWVPVVDRMEEKVEFDLSIRFDSAYQVISNGRLQKKTPEGPMMRWDFDMDRPMSSYLLAFAVGRYEILEEVSASGVPLWLYYPPGESEKARWTYRYSREIFDYLETEIGVAYPWGDYKQVPVSDFLYAGMENTAATLFSDRYLVDSLGYNDENYININAHELAHQWFGNLVTESDGGQHWLHEGFATYYAYRSEMHLFGPEPIYWKLLDTAVALEDLDPGESLLDPGSSSLTFYEKGAWALFILRDLAGDIPFRNGIREFLKERAYGTAGVDDFLAVMERTSGMSLDDFRQTWLEGSTFPKEAALDYLQLRSPSIRQYLSLPAEGLEGREEGSALVSQAWQAFSGPEYREHVLHAHRDRFSRPLLDTLFLQGPLPIWKALLETTPRLEDWMLPHVSGWLDAPSYDLREAALLRLWVSDPEGRVGYLRKVAENGSLEDMSLRQLWWFLSLFTESFATQEETMEYLRRLRETTSPGYPWEVRENAMVLLGEAGALNDQNIRDIVQATEHHSWQFRKFARGVFEQVLADASARERLSRAVRSFPRETYPYAHSKLENP